MSDITNLTEVNKLCRVCLTRSPSMIPIQSPLNKGISETTSLTIFEALEKVMSVKLVMNEKYPSTICAMCKGLLKITYDLNTVFNNSQTRLMEHFKETLLEKDERQVASQENKEVAPVELIFGNNKYNLNDVVIVEAEEQEKQYFQGFLNNLGKAVSAVFVDKSNISKNASKAANIDNHIVEIEPCRNNAAEQEIEAIIDISLEDLQGSNINDLFPDNKVLDLVTDNDTNNTNLLDDLQEQKCIDADSLRKLYKCIICDILCASRSRFKLHLKKYHIHETPYFCEICGSTSFNSSDELPDIISCDDCGSVNTKRRILSKKKIIKNHSQEYLCQICGFISKSASNARYHQQKHLGARYQCNICDKKYLSKANLQWHINCHKNIRDLLCTICGKKFNYYSALVYHMRIHKNERNYACDYCSKTFYMPGSRNRHLRTHTGIRPYSCKYCGKAFCSLGEQRKHEMIHTGERPYKCLYCDKAFITPFNRQVHHMTHSGPHMCDLCPKTFIEIDFLKKHINTKHKNASIADSECTTDMEMLPTEV